MGHVAIDTIARRPEVLRYYLFPVTMRNNIALILLLMYPCVLVTPRSVPQRDADGAGAARPYETSAPQPRPPDSAEKVISVRITSSVAVGRGRGKLNKIPDESLNGNSNTTKTTVSVTEKAVSLITTAEWTTKTETMPTDTPEPTECTETEMVPTDPPALAGANLAFIKQLNSKKEARGLSQYERIHSFPSYFVNDNDNETNDSVAEASIKSLIELDDKDDVGSESIDDVPLARSVPLSSARNHIQGLPRKPIIERNNPTLTTVSFNIVHETPKVTNNNFNVPSEAYEPRQANTELPKPKDQSPNYHRPAEIYSEPAKIYGEPSKIYSEPSKIYSEPAKVYGVPAKVYSEPAKIYSEPAKFYSEPASLHLSPEPVAKFTPWQHFTQTTGVGSSSTLSTTPATTKPHDKDHQPEKNYEVDEKISVLTSGRSHGVQEATTERCQQENCKVGYVVEGRQYRKYRVEEKTSDGFIVGEYGVVRNEDGALRGVRYTADGDASPRLIYDALMKFLQLK